MNFAYFRKSKFSKEETIKNLKEVANANNLNILGELNLTQAKGTLIQVCNNTWIDKIIKNDKNLIGLMPCGILILENNGEVSIGVGNPTILGGVSDNREVQELAITADTQLRKIINEVAGATDPKPSKVKLYSSTTCPYCVMEKQWLDTNKVEHEVVYIDQSQEEARKMVEATGQMGVPVTEVQYEDGYKEFVVGFDKGKLAVLLEVKA